MRRPCYEPEQSVIDAYNLGRGLGAGDGQLAAQSGLKLIVDVACIAVRSEIEASGSVLRQSRPPRNYLRDASRDPRSSLVRPPRRRS
jgi:hypothetical protein